MCVLAGCLKPEELGALSGGILKNPASTRSKGRCQPKACESTGRVQILTAQTVTPVGALCSLMPRMPGITSITEPVFFNRPPERVRITSWATGPCRRLRCPSFAPAPPRPPQLPSFSFFHRSRRRSTRSHCVLLTRSALVITCGHVSAFECTLVSNYFTLRSH